MVSVIIIIVLAQNADVKMDVWLVSACRCHVAAECTALIIQQPDPVYMLQLCKRPLSFRLAPHIWTKSSHF